MGELWFPFACEQDIEKETSLGNWKRLQFRSKNKAETKYYYTTQLLNNKLFKSFLFIHYQAS